MMAQDSPAGVPFTMTHPQQNFRLLELPPEVLELLSADKPPRYVFHRLRLGDHLWRSLTDAQPELDSISNQCRTWKIHCKATCRPQVPLLAICISVHPRSRIRFDSSLHLILCTSHAPRVVALRVDPTNLAMDRQARHRPLEA